MVLKTTFRFHKIPKDEIIKTVRDHGSLNNDDEEGENELEEKEMHELLEGEENLFGKLIIIARTKLYDQIKKVKFLATKMYVK